MPVNWVSIGLGSGLSPVWHQAIAWISIDLFCQRSRLFASDAYVVQLNGLALVQIMACAYPVLGHYLCQYWLVISWTTVTNTQWNSNQNTIATLYKINLEVSSAICPTFFQADNRLTAYVHSYKLHRLHWCNIFLCVMYMLWYFPSNVWHYFCSLERNGHCGTGHAIAGCVGVFHRDQL